MVMWVPNKCGIFYFLFYVIYVQEIYFILSNNTFFVDIWLLIYTFISHF